MDVQSLLDAFPAMFIVVHFQGGEPSFTHVSSGCLALTGYRPEELVGRSSMRDLAYPGDIPPSTSFARMQEKHGMTREHPYFESIFRIVAAGGEIKWVREFGTALFDEEGVFSGIVAVVFDCSQGKNLEYLFERQHQPQYTDFQGMIGRSLPMRDLYRRIEAVARTDVPVLITGESGVGKELVARAIHRLSREHAPFVAVNCGGVSESLLESELFGHVKGAYTGAHFAHKGVLEQAALGTLFLDEIGEVPLSMQAKLLRALDGYGFVPVGGTTVQPCRFRLICATNKNPADLVQSGVMKQDFLFRINTLTLHVPPLRERPDDIALLVEHFLRQFSRRGQELLMPNHIHLSLREYCWPGNVRELKNVIRSYVILGELNLPGRPAPRQPDQAPRSTHLAEREQQAIRDALARFPLQKDAAAFLGIHPRTLQRKLKRYQAEQA